MTETLTQPQIPPREDDDEPCGLTKGQIRALCEPRVPPDFLKQNPSPYSLLVGAVNRREQELAFAEIGQDQLVRICDALEVDRGLGDIAKRGTVAHGKLKQKLTEISDHERLRAELSQASSLLKTVRAALGERGTSSAGIQVSVPELTALLEIASYVITHSQLYCLCCKGEPTGTVPNHEPHCPIARYRAIPKHGPVLTYKMKPLWQSKRLCTAFQLSADALISVKGFGLAAKCGDWVVTPDDSSDPIIMTDQLFRGMFELAQ